MNKNELLRRNLAIYILNDFVTKKKKFQIHHDDLFLNYFARFEIENAIREKYFELNMLFEINEYVCIYFNCQRMRVHSYKSYNKFNFISLNDENSFYITIMNFIINILSTRNFYINKINDAILILMNKLTKHVIYIATIKNLNAKNFTKLFEREFLLHVMSSIIDNIKDLISTLMLD